MMFHRSMMIHKLMIHVSITLAHCCDVRFLLFLMLISCCYITAIRFHLDFILNLNILTSIPSWFHLDFISFYLSPCCLYHTHQFPLFNFQFLAFVIFYISYFYVSIFYIIFRIYRTFSSTLGWRLQWFLFFLSLLFGEVLMLLLLVFYIRFTCVFYTHTTLYTPL